jgi:hypothetical protein
MGGQACGFAERSFAVTIAANVAKTTQMPRPRFGRDLETPALRLPPGKELGSVLAVTGSSSGDLFVLHQPNVQGLDPGIEDMPCWLPPLVHFDADGCFIDAWGGPDHIPRVDGISQWPSGAEGVECDDEGNLWIFGFRADDDAVLKFSQSGKLLLRIGQRGRQGNDQDIRCLGGATSCYHDVGAREVFISDGYRNHRVIAFNSDTGDFTRMWGAYGKDPSLLSEEEGFGTPVHKVALGPQGNLYVADRTKGRVQEFERVPGGARFLREVYIAKATRAVHAASVWDIGFAPDGAFMYVADGFNFRVWSVSLESFEVLGSTTVHTEYENERNRTLQFELVHRFFVEPSGDILLACVDRGLKRLKFEGVR